MHLKEQYFNLERCSSLLPYDEKSIEIRNYIFEKAKEFKYLELTLTYNNNWSLEAMSRKYTVKKAYIVLHKYFKLTLLIRGSKIKLYMIIYDLR